MRKPNLSLMNKNIFLLIEEYIIAPSEALEEKIKASSHLLFVSAFNDAKEKFPGKPIGADEWQPILLEKIQSLAAHASHNSTRLVKNIHPNEEDPSYIFKLSKPQQKQLDDFLEILLNSDSRPDGFIFAYGTHINRSKHSKYKYCDGLEASTFDHNSRLYLMAKHLMEKGDVAAAKLLTAISSDIKKQLQSRAPDKYNFIMAILETAKTNPAVQANQSEIKPLIINFLLMMSGFGMVYLAATAETRGTFWYQTKTSTEEIMDEFQEDLKANLEQKINPKS